MPENGHPFAEEGRLGLVKKNGTGGALARGFRLGKLGFGVMGSYLGYQLQNLLLGESGIGRNASPISTKRPRTGCGRNWAP